MKNTYTQSHVVQFSEEERWKADFVYNMVLSEQQRQPSSHKTTKDIAYKEFGGKIAITWNTVHAIPEQPCWRCRNLSADYSGCVLTGDKHIPVDDCKLFVER